MDSGRKPSMVDEVINNRQKTKAMKKS